MNGKFLALSLCLFLTGCGSPEEREAYSCKNSTMAFVMSQGFVKSRLKSPSTAVFPRITDDEVRAFQTGEPSECKHMVVAYVDAQNSFGGVVRTRYIAVLNKVASKDEWALQDLEME
ncbi:hypothetical protein [Pseudomonas aeruginosa]|uniref:hypothetical protein n=1 Tax=Pseudomonas aeruginosa TaxID=287 RepID=UPI0012988480|nr:hypothetical protein [Pseudomonas aeruginosa]